MASIKDILGKKPEPPKKNSEDFKALFSSEGFREGLRSLHNSLYLNSLPTAKKIMRENGGVSCLYDLYDENETIKSDIDTRIEAITSSMLKVNSDNEAVVELIERSLKPCLFDLIKGIWWSIAHGYSVVELIWDKEEYVSSGDMILKTVYYRKPHEFRPLFDLQSCVNITKNFMNKKVEPFGKYLLTCNGATPDDPCGDPLLARLWWLHLYRCKAMTYWIKALERYGYPFLHGKTEANCVEDLNEVLDNSREGSAITTDHNTDISILNANVNTKQFSEFEDSIRNRIHHAILGQNLTAEVSGGSHAAATVHQGVREDKLKHDIRLIEGSLNRLVRMTLVLNGIPEEEATVELEIRKGLNKERAERDQILLSSGQIRLTEDYYTRNYDLQEGDFEITSNTQPINFSGKTKLSAGTCGHTFMPEDLTPEVRQIEDVVEFLAEKDESGFEIESLFNAIQASNNRKELIEQLSALASNPDISHEELLTQAYYSALVNGATDTDR